MISTATELEAAKPEHAGGPAPTRVEEVLLAVDGLSKKFCRSLKRSLFYGLRDIASESLALRRRSQTLRTGEFWALKDVSFRLHRGESLGLVGPNGAGKSTLLRVASGLIKPDIGRVTVRGKVAPLIALGAGFSPVLTGRENVYANMSILGLTTREIDQRLEAVLDFAEIGEALDAPVRTYSSGMAARLGFACAIHTDPDILLIDEVLAVGDMKFRAKCYRQLAQLRANGTAFILVSHNPHAILSICSSAVYLSEGQLVTIGSPNEVMNCYEEDLFTNGNRRITSNSLKLSEKDASDSSGVDILSLSFKDEQGRLLAEARSGMPLAFCVKLKAHREVQEVNLTLLIREQLAEGDWLLRLSTIGGGSGWTVRPGEYEVQLQLPYCGLRPGLYLMKLSLTQGPVFSLDAVESFQFAVSAGENMSQCLFYQPREWRIVCT